MRKIFRKLLLGSFFALFLSPEAHSQELIFSQFFNAEMFYNPADAGHFNGFAATMLHRSQWQELAQPLTNQMFSASYGFHRKNDDEHHFGGIGMEAHRFDAGPNNLNLVGFSVNPAYNIYFDSDRQLNMSFGIKAGFEQRGINPSDMKWGTQFDPGVGYNPSLSPGEPGISDNITLFDLGAGIDFMYRPTKTSHRNPPSFFVKLAALHLTQPKVSFFGANETLDMMITSDMGARYGFSESFTMGFDFFVIAQGANRVLQPGLFGLYKFHTVDHGIIPHEIKIGTSYRIGDAFIYVLETGNHNYSVGFSYDMNASTLGEDGGAYSAFELSLRLHLVKSVHKDEPTFNMHSPRI